LPHLGSAEVVGGRTKCGLGGIDGRA